MGDTPNIRFKGFMDGWEQRKLGDVATFINGRAYSQPELLSDGKYKVLRVGNFYTNDSWYYSDLELSEKYYADYGDLLYTWSATFGPHIWLGDRVIYHYHIWKVDLSDQLEKQFVVQLLEQDKANILSSKNGSTMVHITKERMEQKDVIIPPNKDEQKAIGAFFRHLDQLITLHRRKCDEIIELKKYMLQKMFPQNGKEIPEIRFAGFIDNWEQRKLGDVFEEYSEKGHPELPALTIIQGSGTIRRDESDRNLQYDKSSLSSYKLVNANDFIVHLRSFEGGIEKATTLGIISPAYHTFHGEGTDSRFYYAYFRSHQFINKDLKPHVYGIRDGRSIDIDGMKTIDIPYTNINEQRAIGDFIEHLDHLISLHQRKCNELKEVKKFMLQNMFPQKE